MPPIADKNLSKSAVEIKRLSKIYSGDDKQPPIHALKDLTMDIPRGSFFGLLGPNGAGKSTLINILAGLVTKTEGSVKITGFDIEQDMRAAKRSIGIVPQELHIDPFFTPREALDLQAGLYGVPQAKRRTEDVLSAVGLLDKADSYARTLSGGMQRRLLVAKAMVHFPQVLVLDEPTAGVDVDLRRQLWAHVRQLNEEGVTVLLTTHYLEEAQALCDHIAIINDGRLIACEETQSLLRRLDSKEMTITLDRDIQAIPEGLAYLSPRLEAPRKLVFQYPPSRINSGEIIKRIEESGLLISDLVTQEMALEDIFIHLVHGSENGGP
jgi:ABC-2 type transport system ATP-binding protein